MGPPERTCIGCGNKRPKGEMVRWVVAADGNLRIDRAGRAEGRGAYLCGVGCLKAALKRKAFGRAFRGKAAPFEAEALEAALMGPGLQTEDFGLDAAPRRSGAAQEGEG